jgi:hypothetical protein
MIRWYQKKILIKTKKKHKISNMKRNKKKKN